MRARRNIRSELLVERKAPPVQLLVAQAVRTRPDLIVVSSVSGHGLTEGLRAISRLRAHPELTDVCVVIGGKLNTSGRLAPHDLERLIAAGYDAVFDDNAEHFSDLVRGLTP